MGDKVLVRKLIEKYEDGDYICREGDVGHDMYIIKSGKVEVLKEMGDTEMRIATLGPKDFFGEMALFGANRRMAAVRAITYTEAIVVTKRMLETQYKKVPDWLVSMIKTIAKRIITTSKGVKGHFKIGLDFTILKSLYLLGNVVGTPTSRGAVLPIDVARDEIMYTTGISYDEVDTWIKRFNLVNFVSIKSGTGMLEIPDTERINFYADFIHSKSREGKNVKLSIDSDTTKSFERIYKLMQR
ncbi:cyclic nucleotide-binding domain-containing protein [candidate division KSB1 bacterium]|nr:cyclic nucleotide-binding domain-containing protein [candidate division KSB1 bacterium]